MKIIKKLSVLIVLLFGILSTPFLALADNGDFGMTLSPTTEEMILTPGEKYESSVRVTNTNSAKQNLDYEISVAPFSQYGSDGSVDDYDNVDTTTVSDYNQIMNWIQFDKAFGSVAPNNTDVISYTINVPKDAPAGGQYATILVTDVTDYDHGQNSGIAIKNISQIGTVLYAEVAGETREEGEILENDMPSFLLNNEFEAVSMVKNNGNVHDYAEYVLQVWPLFSDEEICTNEEEPAKSLVLPNTQKYHKEGCQLPAVGIFRAKQTVKIFGEESTVEKMVIVCPIWLLFLIFFVIAGIVIWIVMRVRARGKKSGKSAEKKSEE